MMCHWKKDGTALTTPTWHTVHTRGFVVRCIAGLTEWALLMRLTPAISETVMTTHTTLHWMLPWLPVYGFIGCCTDGERIVFIIQQLVSISRTITTCCQDLSCLQ